MQPVGTAHFAIGITVMLLHILNVSYLAQFYFKESPFLICLYSFPL